MKKTLLLITFFFSLIIFNASAEEIKNPATLFEKMQEAYNAIESYSYTNSQGEFDTFSKEYQQETADKYGDLNNQYGDGQSSQVSKEPEFKRGLYEVAFKKPFSITMKILSSDYTPSVLNNAEFIYMPEKDPKNFTIKILGLGFIPLEFSRSVTEENTGDFLVMNWTVDFLQLNYFFKNGTAEIKGKETVNKKEAYVLEFFFSPDYIPTAPSYNLGDIPVQAKDRIDYTLGSLERAKFSSVKYWVDTKDLVIIKREEYIGGSLHSTRTFTNISIY